VGGWQVQVKTPPCFHLSGATTGGTVADLPPVGERDRDASFHRTEFLGPESFLPGAALSAVVLSLRHPVVLPSVSDTVILRLSGALDLPPPGTEASPPCLLELVADEPVDEAGSLPGTLVFVHGERLAPYLRHAEVRLAPREGLFPDPMFIRGDPNRDGRVNLADAVWIVSELFGRGPSTLCLEAADANDDTFVDLSDVVYLIRYQLGGGPSPLDPFPECGPDAWPRLLRGGPGCDLGVSCEAPS
jgi:hypothetical protein